MMEQQKQHIAEFLRKRFPMANGITIRVLSQWLCFITRRIGFGDKVLQARYKMMCEMMRDDMGMVETIFREAEFTKSLVLGGITDTVLPEQTSISSRLEITKTKLGHGAYGDVFLGKYSSSNVAVKRFSKTDPKTPIAHDAWYGILKEVALMRQMGTTKVIDCGWYDNRWVIVMEQHQIKSLCWKQHGLCNIQTMTDVITQLFCAVNFVHTRCGFIHGDVKYDNVMLDLVDGKPIVKLIDFGLAEPIRGKIRGNQYIQTIYWRAPELLAEKMCDLIPTDIWASAVCALDIMLGYPIFVKMGVRSDINETQMLAFIQSELASFPAIWETYYDADMLTLARTIYDKFMAFDPRKREALVPFTNSIETTRI
jgi:serine/threonine protein kinase